jgi:hypothetical protein
MLLRLDHEGVKKLIDGYEKEVNAIKENSLRLAWYMRGSISYTDVLNLSSVERELIKKIIEDNVETTKKTNIPFI